MGRKAEIQIPTNDVCRKKRKTAHLPEIFREEMMKSVNRLKPTVGYRGELPTCESVPVKVAYSASGAVLFVRYFRGMMAICMADGLEMPIVWPGISESLESQTHAQLVASADDELVYSSSLSTVLLYTDTGKFLQQTSSLFGEVTALSHSASLDSVYVGEAEGFVSRWELRL